MKNKGLRIFLQIFIIVLALVLIAMTVYEVVVKKDTSSIAKAVVILIGLMVTSLRLFGIVKPRGRAPLTTYRSHYSDLIGNAFAGDAKQERTFLRALEAYATGRPGESLKLLDKLVPSYNSYEDRYALVLFKALCYDDLTMYDRAIELYEQALALKEHSTAASNMGLCYYRMGQYEHAITAYERAIAIDPVNEFPYNNLAQLYVRRQEYEKALEYAIEAARINNKMHQAHSAQAICYAMLGDRENYEKELHAAVLCGSDKNAILSMLRSLDAPVL